MLFTFQACIVNVIENSLHCPARVSLYLEDAKRLAPIFCEDAFCQSLCIYDACDICSAWVIELVRKRPMKVYVFVTTWISPDLCRKTRCYVVSLLWLTTHIETNYWKVLTVLHVKLAVLNKVTYTYWTEQMHKYHQSYLFEFRYEVQIEILFHIYEDVGR
jgi:hypothetical protein